MLRRIKASVMVRGVAALVYIACVVVVNIDLIRSALIGVMASVIPEFYQAWKLSKTENELNPQTWLGSVYRSLFTKWLMAIMIFSIMFMVSSKWDYGVLFLGYLIVQMSGVMAPFLYKGLK